MQRYFYDMVNGAKCVDEDGVEHPDFLSAKAEAVRFFGETLIHQADNFYGQDEWKVIVRDDAGLTLLTFVFLMIESPAIKNSSHTCSR